MTRSTFASLSVPNFRRYISGQAVSLVGTWMQMTALSWLVLELTHSPTKVGLVLALQTLPVTVLGPYGGVIADRVDKRRLMIGLQCAMGLQALVLGLITILGAVQFWEIAVLGIFLGLNNAFENPARQAAMLELVGPTHLRNAISLYSTTINLARVVGPALAGLLIATIGTGPCFLINASSFAFVLVSLLRLDTSSLDKSQPGRRGRGQLRQGIAYVRRTPQLAVPLVMMGIVGCFAVEFPVTLPYMASRALHGTSSSYGFMTASMAAGAVVGGLVIARGGKTGTWRLVASATGFAASMTLAALAPNLSLEFVALALVGVANVAFMSIGNATLQLRAAPEMRGRVMSLWSLAFMGSTPLGGPVAGWTMSWLGPRAGLGLGAVACLVAAAIGALALFSSGITPSSEQSATHSPVPESIVVRTARPTAAREAAPVPSEDAAGGARDPRCS